MSCGGTVAECFPWSSPERLSVDGVEFFPALWGEDFVPRGSLVVVVAGAQIAVFWFLPDLGFDGFGFGHLVE